MTVSKTRLIYTAGTFSVTPELAVCKRLITLVSILRRPPTQEYQNERSNPPKGFLGYVGLFVNSYCERIIPLEFDPQAVILWENPVIQLYYSLLCTGINVVDTIVALGAASTPPAILIPTTPPVSPFQGCPYTSLKFKLLFGTRIQVDTIGEEVVACAGIVPEATVPDFGLPPEKYPSDRSRSEDPPRSDPEDGELPGDTAPATISDPDLGLSVTGQWLISWSYSQAPGLPTCPFTSRIDTTSLSGNSTDVFTIVQDGSNYRLQQNGVTQAFDVGSNCIPRFEPAPVFVPS